MRLARKDLRLILEAARELRLALPLVALVEQLFSALAASGGDEDGTQALVRVLERFRRDRSDSRAGSNDGPKSSACSRSLLLAGVIPGFRPSFGVTLLCSVTMVPARRWALGGS